MGNKLEPDCKQASKPLKFTRLVSPGSSEILVDSPSKK